MQPRSQQTRRRILAASRRLFARYGYHGTTVDRIAGAARANKQRIYEYFTDKRRLFEACLAAAFADVSRQDAALLAELGDDPAALPATVLRHHLQMHARHPDFWRLLAWANLEPVPFYRCLRRGQDERYGPLRALYRQGQARGVFRRDVSFEVYLFVLLAVTYFYHSNRKTLSSTLDAALFTGAGAARLLTESTALLAGARAGAAASQGQEG